MAEEVVIYTRSDCPFCQKAKKDLEERGIFYTEIDVLEHPEAKERIVNLTGKRAVPVIVDGDKVTVGFGGY